MVHSFRDIHILAHRRHRIHLQSARKQGRIHTGKTFSSELRVQMEQSTVGPRFKGFLGTDYFCLLNPKSLKLNLCSIKDFYISY